MLQKIIIMNNSGKYDVILLECPRNVCNAALSMRECNLIKSLVEILIL